MSKSKEFQRSFKPIILLNSIFCTGLIEYFDKRSTHMIGLIYTIINVNIYCTVFYILIAMIHETWKDQVSDLALFMVSLQFFYNAALYITTILAGIIRRKQVRLFMKHLENCVRAMDELGISGSYSALVPKEYLVLLCFFSILSSTIIGELTVFIEYNEGYVVLALYCLVDNISVVASVIIDFSFIFWIRYTKIKLGQLNTMLRNMLTTTVESPQHRRVLRVRDKWKDTNPSLSIYQNSKADEKIEKLKRIKEIHLELIKLARNVNDAFGFHIFMSMSSCFTLIIMLAYNLYVIMIARNFTLKFMESFGLIYWIFFYGLKVFAVNHICDVTAVERYLLIIIFFQHATETGDILCEMYEPSASKEFRKNIREFVQQLIQNPLTFTACGFFDLNHTFINGTIGSITTYLVILIQVGHGTEHWLKNTVENSTATI